MILHYKITKTKKLFMLLLFLLSIVLLAGGCRGADANFGKDDGAQSGKLNVVATIFPIYDFARAVSGEQADVSMLLTPGASVHSFDPAPADIRRIGSADVFLYVGGESDAWVDELLDSIDVSKMKIVRLMDFVTVVPEEVKAEMTSEEEAGAEGEADAELDEHIWTSPKNAMVLVSAIETALCEVDPANATLYKENAAGYIGELEDVDKALTETCDAADDRMIVVADRYPLLYFSNAYNIEYTAAFPGCHDQTDAGARTIAALIETVKRYDLPYVYHVELSNKHVAESICEATGAEMLELHSCETVTKEDFEKGVTYIDLMKRNNENLRKGFGES